MKWFIIVVMMGTFSDGSKDTFLYFKPELESLEHCQEYVYQNASEIKKQMMIEFQGKPIETVFCIREDKIEKILQTPGTKI